MGKEENHTPDEDIKINGDKVDKNKTDSRDKAKRVLMIIAILMIIFGLSYFGYSLYERNAADSQSEKASEYTQKTTASQDSAGRVKNPIDFATLMSDNSEIYAWIKVDGTDVDYPICQSETDDSFYLKHSAYDKSYLASGAIYTEQSNTTTFEDRVTVIYGHNGYKETMFTTLHKFEDSDFFDSHEYFYIYTPKSRLKYQIVSAFKYDDRHIMNSNDFQDNGDFREFIDEIQNPPSTNKNVRSNLEKDITINDNIVVLSTCFTGSSFSNNRYLVCGVLIENEETY